MTHRPLMIEDVKTTLVHLGRAVVDASLIVSRRVHETNGDGGSTAVAAASAEWWVLLVCVRVGWSWCALSCFPSPRGVGRVWWRTVAELARRLKSPLATAVQRHWFPPLTGLRPRDLSQREGRRRKERPPQAEVDGRRRMRALARLSPSVAARRPARRWRRVGLSLSHLPAPLLSPSASVRRRPPAAAAAHSEPNRGCGRAPGVATTGPTVASIDTQRKHRGRGTLRGESCKEHRPWR